MSEVHIKLEKWELLHAATVGMWRQIDNLNKRQDAHGFRGDGWGLHIEGALAEFCVAKYLNLNWSGVVPNPFKLPGDVGILQVRSTGYPQGRLVVHPSDRDEDVFIHVIGKPVEYRLMGWYYGKDAKNQDWWEDPTGRHRHAFWVPNAELHDLATLPGYAVAQSANQLVGI